MIYRNDNIEIKGDYVKGSIKDLKEYFREEHKYLESGEVYE